MTMVEKKGGERWRILRKKKKLLARGMLMHKDDCFSLSVHFRRHAISTRRRRRSKKCFFEAARFSIKENGMSGTQRPLKLSMFWNHCCEWIRSGVCEEQRKKCAGHDE